MGQSVQASEPSAGSSGWRDPICSLFLACCFPIASPPYQTFLFLHPSLFKWKDTWDDHSEGQRLLVWSSLSCWFCTTEMRRGSKYHCGLICPHSLCWLGSELGWASIWCQEKTVWIGTLCLSGFPLMQSSEQSQKTKSQGWPGSQNENHAMFDLPLKARSRGYAPSCQPKWHTHLPWSLVIPASVLWLGAGIHFPCVSAILCRIPRLTLHLSRLSIHF